MRIPYNKILSKKFLITLIIVALLAVALMTLPIEDYTVDALEWIDGLGYKGYVVFSALYALFTVLFLPGGPLTIAAGTLFGILGGFVVVSIGSIVGAAAAFLLGRFFARDMIAKKVAGNKRFAAIDRAVGDKGWKIVFLTRLSPVFPFNLINYAYGLTKIPFWHYTIASWIAMMPGIFVYVYLGSLVGDVARAAAKDKPDGGMLELTFQVIGLIATIIVTVYITRLANRALREAALDNAAAADSAPDELVPETDEEISGVTTADPVDDSGQPNRS